MKRPRFSVRALLVAVLAFAVVSYVLFVRPSVLANRFVAAMERGDYEAAEAFLTDPPSDPLRSQLNNIRNPEVTGTLRPRRTGDIFRFQRSLFVKVRPALSDHKRGIGYQFETVATLWGVKPPKMAYVSFGP
jgi:hypothetical protein